MLGLTGNFTPGSTYVGFRAIDNESHKFKLNAHLNKRLSIKNNQDSAGLHLKTT